MKTLVVPTDFSPISVNAMHYAADMAQSIDASIILVNIFQLPVVYNDIPMTTVTLNYQEQKKSSEDKLEDLKKELILATVGKLQVYTETRVGDTKDEIESLCKSVKPFAIVMGSHGKTGIEQLIMGSTTLSVIRNLKWPVIVVPSGTNYKTIKKIGLACDFKDVIETTPVEYIKDIVREFGAEVHVLNVNEHPAHPDSNLALQSAFLDSMLNDIKPEFHFLDQEDLVTGINKFTEENDLDLVMVIPKKHKLLTGLFHKSNSRELVSHSHIPILSIHD
jgi:nucleotide-binding universal stress UspA family protein